MTFDQQRALDDYTELQRRISVGAYEERSNEHHLTGTYPEDHVEESIDNLTELAAKDNLEFIWHKESGTWTLEPMSEETRAARQEAQVSKCDRCGKEGVALFDLTPAAAPPGVTIYVCNDCYKDEAHELEDDGYDLDLPPVS